MRIERDLDARSRMDERGEITDIIQHTPVEHATIIRSVSGARRGDHYHRSTTQHLYVLSGLIRVLSAPVFLDDSIGEVEEVILSRGDLITHDPYEAHTVISVMDSSFLVLTHGPRGGDEYERDTFRLGVKL